MDAGLAAIIGAGVGAIASVGATALGAIPAFSPEHRADRVRRRQRRDEVVLEATDLIVDCALTGELVTRSADGKSDEKYRKLIALRTELGVMLTKADVALLDLFEECVLCVLEEDKDLRSEAARSFSLGATRWAAGAPGARDRLKQYEQKLESRRETLEKRPE